MARNELGLCVEYFGATLVLCVSDPDHLRLNDARLLGVPRSFLLPEALAAVALLRQSCLGVGRDPGTRALAVAVLVDEASDRV